MSEYKPPERPPRKGLENWLDVSEFWEGIDRRVCPNCRNYFDVGEDSDRVFCCEPCKQRHERGEYV